MSGSRENVISFECCEDMLIGILHRAREANDIGILFVVGGPQYRVGSHRQFVLMARALANSGYPVFRFDHRGMGDSEGVPRTFESVGDDIAAAIREFKRIENGLKDVIAIGLCDAASAILMQVKSQPDIHGMILMNPWVRTESSEAQVRIRHYYLQRILQSSFWVKLVKGGVNIVRVIGDVGATISKALSASIHVKKSGDSNRNFIERMRDGFLSSDVPILIVISDRDVTAGEFTNLVERDRGWKQGMLRPSIQMTRFKQADHTFSRSTDLNELVEKCARWIAANIID